jgi:4a-hydroxytetrahydrobiopterin dehydratase
MRRVPRRSTSAQGEELAALGKQVDGWNVIEEHHITKAFKFPDFREALKFVKRVGELAEDQGHHPDIFLAWGKVEVTIWTHKIKGLTRAISSWLQRSTTSTNPSLTSAPTDCRSA